ncbi:MAG: Cell division protein FtsX [Candidatus Taylorbacteria bacterium]|nr:Cell division protein FtsX [Candidatus Taylorbacteria bacterium]
MIFTKFKRIVRTGFVNFWRNSLLSLAAIVVLTLALLFFGGLIFSSVFGRALVKEVKSKVDINVYFTLNANEADILALQKTVEKLPEVDKATYISKDKALADFRDKWKDNTLILQGLDEIGYNPLPAVLNIKAKEPSQYGGIAKFLDNTKNTASSKDGTSIVEKVNYNQNKLIIDRLGRIIPAVQKTGTALAILLVLVTIVIVFNTIRIIIFTSRDEIAVMKLVGASNTYIRGPFVVSGIMYGIISGIITLILLAVAAYYSDAALLKFAGLEGANDFSIIVNLFSGYFLANFGQIFSIIMGSGVLLGAISSYLAVRRYLNV